MFKNEERIRKNLKESIIDKFNYSIKEWRRGMSMQCKDVDAIEKANTQIQLVKDRLINTIKNI